MMKKNNMKKNILTRIMSGFLFFCGLILCSLSGLVLIRWGGWSDISDLKFLLVFISLAGVMFILSLLIVLRNIEKRKANKIFKRYIFVLFIPYLLLLVLLLFISGRDCFMFLEPDFFTMVRKSNFIPFKSVIFYLNAFVNDSLNKSIIYTNLLGNIVAFMPMGFFLPVLFKKLRKLKNFLIAMLIILVGVELIQLFTGAGECDIDDVILNLFGAIIAFGCTSAIFPKLINLCYSTNMSYENRIKFKVIEKHASEYPNPIVLSKGVTVSVGKKSDVNGEWPNWVFCELLDGSNEGWVPEQILRFKGDFAVALEDYTAKELNAEVGEPLKVLRELNGWFWARKSSNGDEGWIPKDKVGEIKKSHAK